VNQKTDRATGPLFVLVIGNKENRLCVEHYKDPKISTQFFIGVNPSRTMGNEFDYFIATTRFGRHGNFPENPVVHTVGRDGAVFTVIKGRRKSRDDQPGTESE
jgi:hypothetical protein